MPTLTITVLDPPTSFAGMTNIDLVLQAKTEYVPAKRDGNALSFAVTYELKNGNPSGSAIQRGNDGRRFVYLAWMNAEDRTMFRRIKLYFDHLEADLTQDVQATIAGTDAKGQPACATIRPI